MLPRPCDTRLRVPREADRMLTRADKAGSGRGQGRGSLGGEMDRFPWVQEEHGFSWGPMKIIAVMSDRDRVGVVLRVESRFDSCEIRVSPAGNVMDVKRSVLISND